MNAHSELLLNAWVAVNYSDLFRELIQSIIKAIPVVMICLTSAILSVTIQFRRGKIETKKEAVWAFIVSFGLGCLVYYVCSLQFSAFIANAISLGTGFFGREILLWGFNNMDDIMRGILNRVGIKIKTKK